MVVNNRKLRELEAKVFELPTERYTSWIDPRCMSEPERALLLQAFKIAEILADKEELTPQQQTIIDNAWKCLIFRTFDCFTTFMECYLCQGDNIAKQILHERFLWFIREVKEEIRQNLEASRIEAEAKDSEELDRVDQYFRTQRDVFTEENYEDLQNEILRDSGFFDEVKNASLEQHNPP